MRSQTRSILIKSGIGLAASLVLFIVLRNVLGPHAGIVRIDWFERPIDFLQPKWFYLALVLPYFFVVRTVSLTDVSDFQQYLSTGFRSILLLGIAVALARPTWTNSDNKVATIVLVDVSVGEAEQFPETDAGRESYQPRFTPLVTVLVGSLAPPGVQR